MGEGSPFHEHHGIYVEGVHKDVVILPVLWENRLVPVRVDDGSDYGRTGYCIDPVDLGVSKAIAGLGYPTASLTWGNRRRRRSR